MLLFPMKLADVLMSLIFYTYTSLVLKNGILDDHFEEP